MFEGSVASTSAERRGPGWGKRVMDSEVETLSLAEVETMKGSHVSIDQEPGDQATITSS